jgi:ATP-binding cassette, subfamily B, bacterial
MFRFVRPVKWLAAISAFYVALGVGAEVLTTRQTGRAIDYIKELRPGAAAAAHLSGFWSWIIGHDPQATNLRFVVITLFLLVAAMSVLRYFREVASSKFSMNMVFYIREAVYDKLQRVGFSFHDVISSGQLINRALSDLQNVRAFVQTALLTTLEIVLVVSGYIALLVTRNPYIAVLSIMPLPVWVWYILRFSKTVQPAAKAAMEAGDRNVAILAENIAGVHVIKAFATEQQEISRYGKNCDDFFQRTLTRIRLFANFNPIIRSIATVTNLSLIFTVAVLVILHKLAVGDFLVLQASMGAILGRLQAVAQINEQYQNAIVSARRLYEVLMAPPTVYENPAAKPLLPGPGNVRFENVSFGYDAAKPVLHDITIDVKGGGVVAIVGPTGAGKSTLVNLLSRFYDPQRGRVLIDGTDLRDVSLDSLRREVSFVFQETYLFSDTVEANIAYGRPHITGGEVEAAARLAQAHEFIEQLPQGYQTILRERGSSLSGGQKQRLAIARALLTNPRIMVLDDATAAVDPETEDLIRRGMKFAMHGRTTFVIAHRLSTVRAADLVVVLEHGHVSQMGTHEQLIQQDGHYREIAAAQLYGDSGGADEERPSHMDRVRNPRAFANPKSQDDQKQDEDSMMGLPR